MEPEWLVVGILVLFSLRMFPLLLFQGVSPVFNLLLEDCSSEGCSDSGILKWVPNGSGTGSWTPCPLPHSLMLHDVVAGSYRLLR